MCTRELLHANYEKLLSQYNSNVEAVLSLQATLIRDILPSVTDELELSPEATEWAKEWLEDTHTLFRISRVWSFAMESIRKNLVWRLSHLWPLVHSALTPMTMLHCLPESTRDPFGRPILLIQVLPLDVTTNTVKSILIQTFEQLRRHLQTLNMDPSDPPILQYIVLLDVERFSLKQFDVEIFRWIIREVIPRFSGMLAGVFMLNYSWIHSGAWGLAKRVLPEAALSRVFFPTDEELIEYFTRSSLPKDYGGDLPALRLLDDPLRTQETPSQSIIAEQVQLPASDPPSSLVSTSLSPTSLLNPFFGYPTSSSDGFLSLYHGRRRKRDLARTLILLFWIRWRKSLLVGLLLAISAVVLRPRARGSYTQLLRSFSDPKSFLSFKLGSK